jgi:WxcM-like, C-terminal
MIRGVEVRELSVFNDGRGDLVAVEDETNLPFPLRRVFYMAVDDPRIVRAKHATSAHLYLSAISGSVSVAVDNGEERASIRLKSRARAIWTRPGIYIVLRDFAPQTVLMVCASTHFRDTRYFQSPQPHLIEAHALA